MLYLQFWLFAISVSLTTAAPQIFDDSTESNPAVNSKPMYPTSYKPLYPTPYLYPDPYNPEANSYSVNPPSKASGVSFLLILNGLKNNYPSEDEFYEDENKNLDFNVVAGYFNGVEETASNALEALVRKAQSVLKPNENFNDGQLEGLLNYLASKKINKNYAEIKNIIPPEERKETD